MSLLCWKTLQWFSSSFRRSPSPSRGRPGRQDSQDPLQPPLCILSSPCPSATESSGHSTSAPEPAPAARLPGSLLPLASSFARSILFKSLLTVMFSVRPPLTALFKIANEDPAPPNTPSPTLSPGLFVTSNCYRGWKRAWTLTWFPIFKLWDSHIIWHATCFTYLLLTLFNNYLLCLYSGNFFSVLLVAISSDPGLISSLLQSMCTIKIDLLKYNLILWLVLLAYS